MMSGSLVMGAERKGAPLSIDIGQAMRHAAKKVYSVEITGKQPHSCDFEQRFEPGEGIDISLFSDDHLEERIQRNQGLLKSAGPCTKDNGAKIKRKLEQLCEERDKRRRRSMTGNLENGHKQSKSLAFSGELGILKGTHNKADIKFESVGNSNSNHNFLGEMTSDSHQKCNGSKMVSVSSFYSNSGGLSKDSKEFKNSKSRNENKQSVASAVDSGKRNRTTSGCIDNKVDEQSALGLSPSVFSRQFVSNQKKNRHRDSLGASLDTAMEVSDDDEKRGLEDGKSDFQRGKDLLPHQYALRSTFTRKEGFRVTYPSGDPEAVEVQQADLKHLEAYEFLNDTVIDFYIKYLQRPEFLSKEQKPVFHFFNTFFFKKLLLEKRKRKNGDFYQSKLRNWTKGIDIFEKKYLLVPVHNCAHWSLAIICFAIEKEVLTPYILHLDSMKEGHVSEEVFNVLKGYLDSEWNHARGRGAVTDGFPSVLENVFCKRVEVPQQQNAWDCGLFLLYFIELFLRDAKSKFEPRLLDSMFGRKWFKPQEASNLRTYIKCLLENLVEKVNSEIVMEDMD